MAQRRFLTMSLMLASLAVAGCESAPVVKEPVEVRVPVPVRAEPPEELKNTFHVDHLPEFVSPSEPDASSALDAENEQWLKIMLIKMKTRIRAWEAWGIHE